MERLNHQTSIAWHGAINAHVFIGRGEHKSLKWMYEAKTAADEVPRLATLFKMERENALPKVHKQCSLSPPEPVSGNHLTCCLGKKCSECPHLKALDKADMDNEQVDLWKAWTCMAHILMSGGDVAGEGYVLRTDDRIYWDRVYSNLQNASECE